jgi:hypothetical protein
MSIEIMGSFKSYEKIFQRELDAAAFPEQEFLHTGTEMLDALDTVSSTQTSVIAPCAQRIYLLGYSIFQKFFPPLSQRQRFECHALPVRILSAKEWDPLLSKGHEVFVALSTEMYIRSIKEDIALAGEHVSFQLAYEGMTNALVGFNSLEYTEVPSNVTIEVFQHCAEVFARISPHITLKEALLVYRFMDKNFMLLRETRGYKEHRHAIDAVMFSALDTLCTKVASDASPGDDVIREIFIFLVNNLTAVQNDTLNESSLASLRRIEPAFNRLVGRPGTPVDASEAEEIQLAIHTWMNTQSSLCSGNLLTFGSGTIPSKHLRSIEKSLILSERGTTLFNQTSSLLALELLAMGLLGTCVEEGLHLESCQESYDATFREDGPRSALHTRLEDAMAMEQLDVACAAYCSAPSSPEAAHWRLFAVWRYVRKFIGRHKVAQRKICKEFKDQWEGIAALHDRRFKGVHRSHFIHSFASIMDLSRLYNSQEFVCYEDLCQGHPLPAKVSQKDVIADASRQLTSFYLDIVKVFTDGECEGREEILSYAQTAASFISQVAKSVGYLRLGHLAPFLPIDGTFVTVYPRDCTNVQWCRRRFVPRLIDGLMKEGEEGVARAICQSFAPGNERFLSAFLQTVRLSSVPRDDHSQIEPEESEEAPSASGEAAPPASAPNPSQPVHRNPKKKDKGRITSPSQKPQSQLSVRHSVKPMQTQKKDDKDESAPSASGKAAPAASAPPLRQPSLQSKQKQKSARETSVSEVSQPTPAERRIVECACSSLTPPKRHVVSSDASTQDVPASSPVKSVPTCEGIIQGLLSTRLQIDERITAWRKEWFSTLERNSDEVDFHIYPPCFASLVRGIGESGPWASPTTGKLTERSVCIGQIHRPGRRDKEGRPERPFVGRFTEGFGKDKKLFHHFFQVRDVHWLLQQYEKVRSFYEVQENCVIKSDFQEELYRKASTTGSFFDPLPDSPSSSSSSPRFLIQTTGATVRITDRHTVTVYTFASPVDSLLVSAVPVKGKQA